MHLNHIKLQQFKNYASAQLSLHSRLVCISGANGSGKTNLLDAIHYLSTGKSALNALDSQNIQLGTQYFTVEGIFETNHGQHKVFCGNMQGQRKQLKLDGATYGRMVEHYGKFPCVMVGPQDITLITEGNEGRRKFVDSTISLYNDYYLDCLLQYNQLLQQRNAHLKQHLEGGKLNEKLIDVYDKQMAQFAVILHDERKVFCESFSQHFSRLTQVINQQQEKLGLRYVSHLDKGHLLAQLRKSFGRDKALGRTEVGPHKDQWIFEIDDQPLKKFGSQGQQKSHLLGLVLAKAALVYAKTQKPAILLLDDVFDRLDDKRVAHLTSLVAKEFGQTFITDTSKERLEKIAKLCKVDAQMVEVQNGQLKTNTP